MHRSAIISKLGIVLVLMLVAAACVPYFAGSQSVSVDQVGGNLVLRWSDAIDVDEGGFVDYYHLDINGTSIEIDHPTIACELGGLTSGQTYNIAVTAYDNDGDWSGVIGGPVSHIGTLSTTYVAASEGLGAGPPTCVPLADSTAQLIAPAPIVAGGSATFDIEVTLGSGVTTGGGIAVGMHHASEWIMQVSAPLAKNHVAATTTGGAVLDVERHIAVPEGMFVDTTPGLFSDFQFHWLSIARVTSGELVEGDKVVFTFGSNANAIDVPRSSSINDQELRITIDDDANGVFDAIAESPTLRIVHAPAAHFAGVAPSQVTIGQSVDLVIRAEDQFLNLASDYSGSVSLHDENGTLLQSGVALTDGMATTQIVLNSQGHHRIRITADAGNLEGRSNPLRAYATLPAQRLYWGDLHGHTGISDGLGENAEQYFAFGRDVGALDFIALTDHGNFDWAANVAAVQSYHDPGEFVTLLAQEAGAQRDHMNLYFRSDDTEHISQWQTTYAGFLNWTYNQYNTASDEAITVPHHFTYNRGNPLYPFGIWDDRIVRLAEVYSAHGTNEYFGNPRSLNAASTDQTKYLQGGLAAGRKFGVIAASDNHDSKPGRTAWGRYPGGLAAVWTTDLTRDAVWDALWNYRTYGTSVDRIYVEVDVDGHGMGESFSTGSATVDLAAYVIGKTDVVDVTVVHNNQDVATISTTTGLIETTQTVDLDPGENFVYLRVTQDNGERAWSTPVWITRT